MYRLLLIDNDAEVGEMLCGSLGTKSCEVVCIHDAQRALEHVLTSARSHYDLILLNIDLPIFGGLRQLRAIRAVRDTPVIICTESCRKIDGILALENGADHYMVKPLDCRELHARIRSVLRGTGLRGWEQFRAPAIIVEGDIAVDVGGRIAHQNGRQLRLTAAEFGLLQVLVSAAGHVLSREHLAQSALGRPLGSNDRSIDMLMSRLRKKMGEHDGGGRIKTVRGQGFVYTVGDQIR
ncbi:MAG: response regulator transcription factor [Syntrophobacteraceae bacterium]